MPPGTETAIERVQTTNDPDERGVIIIAGRRYSTLARFAKKLGKSTRTLSRYNEQGIGPPTIAIGNMRLIDEEKVPGWLARFERKPTRLGRRR